MRMDSKTLLCLLLFMVSILFATTSGKANEVDIEEPLFIGSFNIQNLGSSKFKNKTVMGIVKKVLVRYDLAFIQEIVTLDEDLMVSLVSQLNEMLPNGKKFQMTISERLGRGTAKEQYAYLYRDDKLRLLKSKVYPDSKDEFMRPPFIAHFATPTLRDMDSMIAIGVHTQPKNAANETSSLAKVYEYAKRSLKIQEAIIMGDMNAGCANVRISDWDNIKLWNSTKFTWLTPHDMDTTVATSCCPYDRFVTAGEGMNNAVIWESVQAYKYRDILGISVEMALAVSDHWPIEVKLRGDTSKEVDENIDPRLCISLRDERKRILPAEILKQKSTLGFSIETTENRASLYMQSSDSDDVIGGLQKMTAKYQQFLSTDIVKTIQYKTEHGALNDASSYNDLQESLSSANILFENGIVTVIYCVATTIN